jgi:type II secretory pathway component GspD/PulD (secretin)
MGATVGNTAELSVSENNGKLLVTADADTQQNVERLLNQIEARRAVQVEVRMRELTFFAVTAPQNRSCGQSQPGYRPGGQAGRDHRR